MKKIFILSIVSLITCTIQAQEFAKHLTEARTTYAAGKFDDSRFAMQQMLQELDIIVGKEILKVLPSTMLDQNSNAGKDEVSGTSGFLGVMIHREYGTPEKISLEIISNSPMLTSINALLSIPIMGSNGDNKTVKVAGYKALLQKISGENEKAEYEIQLPLNSSLLTLKAPGYSQDQLLQMANTIPVSQIAKLLQ